MKASGLALALIVFSVFTSVAFPEATDISSGSNMLVISVNARLSVADPAAESYYLTGWAEKSGGYYTLRSDMSVALRVPVAMQGSINDALGKRGTLTGYNVQTRDAGSEYLVLKRQLDSREKLLGDYRKLLAQSDFSGTLMLERELTALLTEIESLKGRIIRMMNDSDFISLVIDFYSEDYPVPPVKPSVFDWINRIDFYEFTGSAHYEQ